MAATQQTRVEFYSQREYDIWLATNPDFSRITHFWAYNLSLITALPDMPAVTHFWVYNLPLITALPDMPAVTHFRADSRLTKIRNAMPQV